MGEVYRICSGCGREVAWTCAKHPRAPLYGYSEGDPIPRPVLRGRTEGRIVDLGGMDLKVVTDPECPPGRMYVMNPAYVHHEPLEALLLGTFPPPVQPGRMHVIVERTDEANREFSEQLLRKLS